MTRHYEQNTLQPRTLVRKSAEAILFMADTVRVDLRDMGAEAWVMWQPDWDVIAFDANGGAARPQKQYYALAQYTRFIRPGFQIISAGVAYHTLAAYSPAAKRLAHGIIR